MVSSLIVRPEKASGLEILRHRDQRDLRPMDPESQKDELYRRQTAGVG